MNWWKVHFPQTLWDSVFQRILGNNISVEFNLPLADEIHSKLVCRPGGLALGSDELREKAEAFIDMIHEWSIANNSWKKGLFFAFQ